MGAVPGKVLNGLFLRATFRYLARYFCHSPQAQSPSPVNSNQVGCNTFSGSLKKRIIIKATPDIAMINLQWNGHIPLQNSWGFFNAFLTSGLSSK